MALQRLAEIVLHPIEVWLPERGRVVLVPQGPLLTAPFAALSLMNGDLFLERYTPVTVPSLRWLKLMSGSRKDASRTALRSLVVGDPGPADSSREGRFHLARLPGAATEARVVAALLRAEPLIGPAATKSEVLRQLPGTRRVHLAVHRAESKDRTGLLLFPDDDLPEGDDALLTAEEVSDLDLRAELVVLPACGSGLGRLSADGVLGLARAFVVAGADAVVASLWPVDDRASVFLMERFYTRLLAGVDGPESLRVAMLETRELYPEPQQWAGFTWMGAWPEAPRSRGR